MKKLTIGLMVALIAAGSWAGTFSLRPLDVQEAAIYGASHVATLDYQSFPLETTTNAVAYMTNAVAAKTIVEFRGMILDTAFNNGNAAWTDSVSVVVGDGTTEDLYLEATELAADGSEVFAKYPTADSLTIASTPTLKTVVAAQIVTNWTYQKGIIYDSTGVACSNASGDATAIWVTGVVAQVVTPAPLLTNLTVASTATRSTRGYKFYSTAGNIVAAFTPLNTFQPGEAMASNTTGRVNFYFRVRKPNP